MKLLRKLRALLRVQTRESAMSEEMRTHLELLTRENLRRGLPADEARNAALRAFGSVERIKERVRDQRPGRWLAALGQDLRYALRQSARAPGFTATIVLTIGLGIGACTGVYSVVDGLLLHPIGHDPHPENELRLHETKLPGITDSRVAPANFRDWQRLAACFAALRASVGADLTLTGAGEPARLTAARASRQFLEVHGWPLALGRGFTAEEDAPGGPKAIIVSHRIWQRHLGGDPAALGRPLLINDEPHMLVGVISEEVGRFSEADAFVPLAFSEADWNPRDTRTLGVWARLRPGVTLAQAQAEMNVIAAQLARQYPDTNHGWGAALISVVDLQGAGGVREALWVLLAAVGCVLLIACVNVANLLLARALARHRELAVRAALGAGRARLVRQLLTESVLLACLGGALGVGLAHGGLQLVHAYAGPRMQRLGYIELNLGMLGWALALSVGTGVVFGLAPAWLAARTNLNDALKQGARGATTGAAGRRLRQALVIVQVALAMALLASAGALIRRLVTRANLDPGFVAENASVMQVNLSRRKYPSPERQVAFATAALEQLRAVPGVEFAAATTALPIFQPGLRFQIDGRPPRPREEWPVSAIYGVTPDYFSAMGIGLRRGRAFNASDHPRSLRVAIINETFAREHFPGEDPIGRRIAFAGEWREIVGVVADVTQFGNAADTAVTAQCYEPLVQRPGLNLGFVVRARGDAATLRGQLKPAVYAVDKDQPVASVRGLQDVVDERMGGARFATHLLVAFAVIALAIAAVGIYALLAYSVGQRTTEIGIRMALGATARDVRGLVFGAGARLVGIGFFAGGLVALAAGRLIESMLFNAQVRHGPTFAVLGALIALVGLLACWLPARRAARVDPLIALRAD